MIEVMIVKNVLFVVKQEKSGNTIGQRTVTNVLYAERLEKVNMIGHKTVKSVPSAILKERTSTTGQKTVKNVLFVGKQEKAGNTIGQRTVTSVLFAV